MEWPLLGNGLSSGSRSLGYYHLGHGQRLACLFRVWTGSQNRSFINRDGVLLCFYLCADSPGKLSGVIERSMMRGKKINFSEGNVGSLSFVNIFLLFIGTP